MKSYFAYIRVSTTRQGEEGVSLQEQRRAIVEYASRRGITVTEWFEEQLSAAKRGRPVFTRLVCMLKSKQAAGIIIHKIDRGARNLRDWADMADLMDRGIEVHFAHESIDLHTRSGRLSADILAVVAADYIRNLREEVVKGINGRLKQGLFPFAAPVGYLNNGSGKVKTVDPVRGPFVTLAFELYASRQHTLQTLADELFARGFRTKTGNRVRFNQLATILRNPFYIGLISLRGHNDMFPGLHVPLVTSTLYNQVQLILDRKRTKLRQHNQFLLRSLIRCDHCKLSVIAERKKGHIYYRCHRRNCPITCIREERLESMVIDVLKKLSITSDEEPILAEALADLRRREIEISGKLERDCEEELSRIQHSIKRILETFLDNVIPKELFDEGHSSLLMERRACEERLAKLQAGQDISRNTQEFIASLRSMCEIFCTGAFDEKRKVLDQLLATFSTNGSSNIRLSISPLMQQIACREKTKAAWEMLLPAIIKELAAK